MTGRPILGNKHAWLLLGAFVAGQVFQLILQAVSRNLSQYYQERFCMAAGFIIAFVFFAGMLVDAKTRPEKKEEAEDEDKAA